MNSLNIIIQKITIAGILMLACTLTSWSQKAGNKSYLDLELQYFQNKDLRNYGLVFSGGNLAVGYTREMQLKSASLTYQAEFGLGPGFSKSIASL